MDENRGFLKLLHESLFVIALLLLISFAEKNFLGHRISEGAKVATQCDFVEL
jgi:hypothetical protein